MTRLTYNFQDKRLVTQTLLINNKWGFAVIEPETLAFAIVCGEDVVATGTANSLEALKKKVKATLKELGCNFQDEVRNRGKVEKFKL